MKTSEKIEDLFTALAKAQGAFEDIKKTKTGAITEQRKYKYADLGTTLAAVIPALSANGLALIQPAGNGENGMVITTMLVHGPSGQWISEEYHVPLFAKPQDQGIALTYARRYSVWALLGVAPEDDDDAQGIRDVAPQQREKRQEKPKEQPPLPSPPPSPADAQVVSKEERDQIIAAIKAKFTGTADDITQKSRELLLRVAGVEKSSRVPRIMFAAVMKALAEKDVQTVIDEQVDETFTDRGSRDPGADDE